MNFLNDKEFLRKLNKHNIRHYVARIRVLDFATEQPFAVLEGKVVSGNFSISSSSSVRRTGNLTLIADQDTINISDLNNLVAINKKISLSIGFKNPFIHEEQYAKYGTYLYFQQGIFFITAASSSFSTSGATVSLSLVDKMGGLNGTCGGTLLASTSFHDRIEVDKDGNETTTYPLIKDIIKECVHHLGGEHYSKIIVEDVDDVGRIQVNYNGDTPLRMTASNYEVGGTPGRSFIIEDRASAEENEPFPDVYTKGKPIGYMETPLTYPGELIMGAGSTVEAVLGEIAKTLGNFEYFYDVEGNFHFRRIKDFQMTGQTPLNWSTEYDKDLWGSYFPRYGHDQYINEFADPYLVMSVSYSPKYDNIKNDFVVWGTGNDSKSNSNTDTAVRYHLAIDRRPKDSDDALCRKTIYKVTDNDGQILRYVTSDTVQEVESPLDFVSPSKIYIYNDDWYYYNGTQWVTEGVKVVRGENYTTNIRPLSYYNLGSSGNRIQFDWREELYRQGLVAYGSSTDSNFYYEELAAEWRDIFDPGDNTYKSDWEAQIGTAWTGYNPNVKLAPNKIRYWLDIIDSAAPIGGFSVQQIGRRTKVSENNKVRSVFAMDVPDVVFTLNENNVPERVEYYNSIGQDFAFISADQQDLFKKVNAYGTCYDDIRQLLMTNLIYNSAVNLTTIPIFYLDVNQLLHLNFPKLGIVGDYVIKNISWSLGSSMNSMQLTLNEANVIV